MIEERPPRARRVQKATARPSYSESDDAIFYDAIPRAAIFYDAIFYDAIFYDAIPRDAILHDVIFCSL